VSSRQIDNLESTVIRHGYAINAPVEQFDFKAGQIKALSNNTLDATRSCSMPPRRAAFRSFVQHEAEARI